MIREELKKFVALRLHHSSSLLEKLLQLNEDKCH